MCIPNITKNNGILFVNNFPQDRLARNELSSAYSQFITSLDTKPKEVVIDLANISEKNINSLALIDSFIALCNRFKINLKIENHSKEVELIIKNLDSNRADALDGHNWLKDNITSFFTGIGESSIKFFKEARYFLEFIGEIASTIIKSFKNPKKIQWKETLYYMDRAGADAVPIVALICFLMGGILAYQGSVQMGRFGLSIFVANLVGLSITKELGALMVAMICIGRAGSAFAAEIGTMKVSEEIDAMSTMGLHTTRFLVMPKLIALVVVMPMLTIIGDVTGVIGGMFVGVMKSGVTIQQYYGNTIQAIDFASVMEGVIKSIVFAILIAGIGCLKGYKADNDAKGVGKAATSAVVGGIFLIVIADALLTAIFN
ncbi:MAG TPA: ABC transporter permease [Victivallales bacterium]|nr:ABC transporter permease [Victivallales bacterium]